MSSLLIDWDSCQDALAKFCENDWGELTKQFESWTGWFCELEWEENDDCCFGECMLGEE